MERADVRRRVARLRREIRRHDRLYYEQARPEISDAEYDALVRELRALEARHPGLVTPGSPTRRPGGRPARAFAAVELVGAIAASRARGLARLLGAVGIPGVGEHVARLLAERFGALARLARASRAELARVRGIGPVLARSVAGWLADRRNRRVLARLAAAGVAMHEDARAFARLVAAT